MDVVYSLILFTTKRVGRVMDKLVTFKSIHNFLKNRSVFVFIGIVNIVLFHVAISKLFLFLYDSSARNTNIPLLEAVIINGLLILFFSAPHSFLLNSKVKKKLLNCIPTSLYSTMYSIHACLAILLIDRFWCQISGSVYILNDDFKIIFDGLYGLSWFFMFWAMLSTGLFRQSGIEEWYKSLKNQKMKYSVSSGGAYTFCRQPIYSAFLAMIWTTPNMTYDHFFLSILWTLYIVWGAGRKEKRLFKNANYKIYAKDVSVFPLLGKAVDNLITQRIWRI